MRARSTRLVTKQKTAIRKSAPNAGKTFDQLITLPSPLEDSFLPTLESLRIQRLANQPTRATEYYFSASGSDSNLGTEASPWLSVARMNEVLNPLTGDRIAAVTHTVADSTGFKVNGRSFWCGGWVKHDPTQSYFGPMFACAGSFGLYVNKTSGTGTAQPFVLADPTFVANWSSTNVANGVWAYLECWHDFATSTTYLCVNNGTPVSTSSVTFPNSSNPFTVGVNGGGYLIGEMARLFFVRDVVPTAGQRAQMYNSGKGLRSYLLGSLKSVFTANSGSFWDLAGVSGTTTYPDAISGKTLTRATGQSPVNIPGPDDDAAIGVSGGAVTGGCGISVLLKRGDRFVFPLGGALQIYRQNFRMGAYGTSSTRPIISARSVTVPLSSWTLVSGTRYKCTCSGVGWLFRATEVGPTDVPLFKEKTAVLCGARTNSFFYDNAAGELHVNIGSNPNGVQFEATPRVTDANAAGTSNQIFRAYYVTLEDIHFQDAGITEAGNAAGYGMQCQTDIGTDWSVNQPEGVISNCWFSGGYHNLGTFTVGGSFVVQDCLTYNLSARNNSGADDNASGDFYVSFGRDQEVLRYRNLCGGYLPSWDVIPYSVSGGTIFSGVIVHGQTGEYPNLIWEHETRYLDTPYRSLSALSAAGRPTEDTFPEMKVFIVGITFDGNYPPAFGSCNEPNVCSMNLNPQIGPFTNYYFSGATLFAINCTYKADMSTVTANVPLFRSVLSTAKMQMVGCRFDLVNMNYQTRMLTGAGPSIDIRNSIFSTAGSGAIVLGAGATSTDFVNNAWYGAASGLGTGGVLLSSNPSLTTPPSTSSQLYNAGTQTNRVKHDKNKKTRLTTPTIGPIEAE